MASEQLDLTIDPESKGIRIITLRSPLYVRGTFKIRRRGKTRAADCTRCGGGSARNAGHASRGAAGVDFAIRRGSQSVPDDFVADEEVRCGLLLPGGGYALPGLRFKCRPGKRSATRY